MDQPKQPTPSNPISDMLSMMGSGFSPAVLDLFVLHMKNALAMAENVPPEVTEAAENFRLAVKKWSADLKGKEGERKTA